MRGVGRPLLPKLAGLDLGVYLVGFFGGGGEKK